MRNAPLCSPASLYCAYLLVGWVSNAFSLKNSSMLTSSERNNSGLEEMEKQGYLQAKTPGKREPWIIKWLTRGCIDWSSSNRLAGWRGLSRVSAEVLIMKMRCSCWLLPDSGTPADNHHTKRRQQELLRQTDRQTAACQPNKKSTVSSLYLLT